MSPQYLRHPVLTDWWGGEVWALDLRWSTGEHNISVETARVCTLLVTSGDSEGSLPREWQLAWTARSTVSEPIRFLTSPPTTAEAGVCEVRPARSASSILSRADTVLHCATAGGTRARARCIIWIDEEVSATIRLVPPPIVEPGTYVTTWPEIRINGGSGLPFAPTLTDCRVVRSEGQARIHAVGSFDTLIRSAVLVLKETGERIDLPIAEQTSTRLTLDGPGRPSLTGRVEVRDLADAVGAIDIQDAEPVARDRWAKGKVIVRFKPGEVDPPAGRVEGSCAEFQARSASLLANLTNAGVIRMERLFPWFRHEDVQSRNLLGEPVTLEDMADFYIAHLSADVNAETVRSTLEQFTEVLHAELDVTTRAFATFPNDPYFQAGLQWGLHDTGQTMCGLPGFGNADINAPEAWDRSMGASSVKIAILDTGIDSGHPDLYPRVFPDTSFVVAEGELPIDYNGHGTAVAGIAAAKGGDNFGVAGVAWNVTPVAIKILDSNGFGDLTQFAKGIDRARVKGYPIINISAGAPNLPDDPPPPPAQVSALNTACNNAFLTGQFVVASSGNTESSGDYLTDPRFDAVPAAFMKRVYAVGAFINTGLRWRDEDIAGTNFCAQPTSDCRSSNYGPWLDALAPGGRFIVTTKNFSVTADTFFHLRDCDASNLTGTGFAGTSAAAPFVSGTAALLRSYALSFTPPVILTGDDLEQLLNIHAAYTFGLGRPDQFHGYGRIRANTALDFIAPPKTIIQDYLLAGKPLASLAVGADSMQLFNRTFLNVPELGVSWVTNCWRIPVRGVARHGGFNAIPAVWVRPSACKGWRDTTIYSAAFEVPWGRVTSVGTDSSSFETYVYRIPLPGGGEKYFPEAPPQARVAYTVLGVPRPVDVETARWADEFDIRTAPNPGYKGIWINLALPSPGTVRIGIFDVTGRNVANLEQPVTTPGPTRLWWDAKTSQGARCSGGVYWCRVDFEGTRKTKRFVLVGG